MTNEQQKDNLVSVTFDYDEPFDFMEFELKGFCSCAKVHVPEGFAYEVEFIEPVRLSSEIASSFKLGEPVYATPGLIVIPRMTKEGMIEAARRAYEKGYFDHLKPL